MRILKKLLLSIISALSSGAGEGERYRTKDNHHHKDDNYWRSVERSPSMNALNPLPCESCRKYDQQKSVTVITVVSSTTPKILTAREFISHHGKFFQIADNRHNAKGTSKKDSKNNMTFSKIHVWESVRNSEDGPLVDDVSKYFGIGSLKCCIKVNYTSRKVKIWIQLQGR